MHFTLHTSTSTYPHSTVAPLLLESSAQGVPMFQSHSTGLCHAIVGFFLCGPWSKDPPALHNTFILRCGATMEMKCGHYPLLYPTLGAQNRGSWVKRIKFSCFVPFLIIAASGWRCPAHMNFVPSARTLDAYGSKQILHQIWSTTRQHHHKPWQIIISFVWPSVMTFWVFGRSSDQYPMR